MRDHPGICKVKQPGYRIRNEGNVFSHDASRSLRVSALCLGTMNFGGPASEAAAVRVIDLCRDAGINFIDTANVYTGGQSEEIVGPAIKRNRSRWVLATKANGAFGDGPNERGSSRKAIMDATQAA